jgi:hypothetical protein
VRLPTGRVVPPRADCVHRAHPSRPRVTARTSSRSPRISGRRNVATSLHKVAVDASAQGHRDTATPASPGSCARSRSGNELSARPTPRSHRRWIRSRTPKASAEPRGRSVAPEADASANPSDTGQSCAMDHNVRRLACDSSGYVIAASSAELIATSSAELIVGPEHGSRREDCRRRLLEQIHAMEQWVRRTLADESRVPPLRDHLELLDKAARARPRARPPARLVVLGSARERPAIVGSRSRTPTCDMVEKARPKPSTATSATSPRSR